MDRVAIDLGFIQIYWYSLTMLFGVLFGALVAFLEVRRQKMNLIDFENMAFYAILSGFLGARIYYVLFNLDYYLKYPGEIIAVWNGGLAIHGAIIGSCIAILLYCKKKKMPFLKILDICVPGLLLGQIIGRWGNFFNGEAHGGVVTRAFLEKLHLPNFIIDGMNINGVYYHPTFLYESMLNLVCFIVLIILRRNKKIKTGMFVGIYMIWYGVVRFFVEGLRTDSLMLGSLRMAQVISIFMVVLGIGILIWSRRHELYNKE